MMRVWEVEMKSMLLFGFIGLLPCFILGWSCSVQWAGQTHSVPKWFRLTRFKFLVPFFALLVWAVIIGHWSYDVSSELRAVSGLLSLEVALIAVAAGVVSHRVYLWLWRKSEEARGSYGNDATGY
jgi:hypothetical protein